MKRTSRPLAHSRLSSHASRKRQQRRQLSVESLESRRLMALLSSGAGDGHLSVLVNEYGAFGRSGTLEVSVPFNANGPREIGDAIYNPVGPIDAAGTVFESGLAVKVGSDPVQFLTAGTIADSGNFDNGVFDPDSVTPNNRSITSTFYYPSTVPSDGTGAVLRFDLTQEIILISGPGTTPIGVTLRQTYTVTNLTANPVDVSVWRYMDGDMLFDNSFNNDGAGMREVVTGDPEFVWMTNNATNTNRNDPTYMEVRSDPDGIFRPDRWEVGLSSRSVVTTPNPPLSAVNPGKHQPHQLVNGPLVSAILAGQPLLSDIVRSPQADLDGNNKVDNGSGDDWAVAMRNFYTLQGAGTTVYVTETMWGNPEIGDPEPPVIPNPQFGTVTGVKFSDRDGDGVRDNNEAGVGGFRIFADSNGDGAFNFGEPSTITDGSGFYQLFVGIGTHNIREVNQANWTQTFPVAPNFHTVTIVATGDLIQGINFGNQAAPGSISGMIFEDFNKNGRFDSGEPGIGNAFVYSDLNNDGQFQSNEPNTTSAPGTGAYTLANLDPRQHIIRQAPPAGFEQTIPSNNAPQIVSVQPGQTISGINFGNILRNGQVAGKVYLDTNGNGLIDPGEPGAAGVIVYLDRDNDCQIGLGENGIVTGPSGTFGMLGIRPGTYTLRLSLPAGIEQVLPGGGSSICDAGYVVTVEPGQTTPAFDFLVGNTGGSGNPDFGDAPSPYPTTLAQNGARHVMQRNFGLGATRDGEANGQPTFFADGDDNNLLSDEDGVQFVDPLIPGRTANIRVIVDSGSVFPGRLQGFMDWNADGDWNDNGERIILDRISGTGTHIIPIQVPSNATIGRTYARFRYGYEMGLGPAGPSVAGEVEDYSVFVVGSTPDARDDTYSFNSLATQFLNVISGDTPAGTDIPSKNGPLTITSVNLPPGFTGTVEISADKQMLIYTPSGTSSFDQFTYTVVDPAGLTDTATVRINITLPPLAIDDTFPDIVQPVGPGGVVLDVLANDVANSIGGMTILSTTLPSEGGQVEIVGGQTLVYRPINQTFSGTETFTYTVTNGAGVSSTANVTVQVTNPNVPSDDLVELDVVLLKLNGQAFDDPSDPNDNTIGPGQRFKVMVTVDDLRPDGPDRGVFAAYLDLLYDADLLKVVSDPTTPDNHFNPALGFNILFNESSYPAGQSGSIVQPGIINETGAFQGNASPLGTERTFVFIVTMEVKALPPDDPSSNADDFFDAAITTDPADLSPDNDVLLYEPETVVPDDQIRLNQALVPIERGKPADNSDYGPQPEGSRHSGIPVVGLAGNKAYRNGANPYDVNGDSFVSPLDALLIINSLNIRGPRSLLSDIAPSSLNTPVYLDVDGDDILAPIDALLVITHLNAARPQGEAAAESDQPVTTFTAAASVSGEVSRSATLVVDANSSVVETESPSPTFAALETSATSTPSLLTSESAELIVAEPTTNVAAAKVATGSYEVDFGSSTTTSSDGSDDFEDLLTDIAQETCLFWHD